MRKRAISHKPAARRRLLPRPSLKSARRTGKKRVARKNTSRKNGPYAALVKKSFESPDAAKKFIRLIEAEGHKVSSSTRRFGKTVVAYWENKRNPIAAGTLAKLAAHAIARAVPNRRRTRAAIKGRRPIKKARRKNPGGLEHAQEIYAGFHGRPSEETITISTPIHDERVLVGLGELVALRIETPSGAQIKLDGFTSKARGAAVLAMNKRRTQLFIEGGDQSVRLSDFGIREPIHETEVLGELLEVFYFTTKDHLGDDGGEATYRHKHKNYRFRRRPTVIYSTVDKLISFAGGNYSIPDEGITD